MTRFHHKRRGPNEPAALWLGAYTVGMTPKESTHRDAALAPDTPLLATLLELAKDVQVAKTDMARNDMQPRRRAYVRSVLALGEGTVWIIKQELALRDELRGNQTFSLAERLALREASFEVTEQGDVKQSDKFLRLEANLRLVTKCFKKATRQDLPLPNKGEPGWTSVRNAIAARNRITHPKGIDSMPISDEELGHVKAAEEVFEAIGMKALRVFKDWPSRLPLASQR